MARAPDFFSSLHGGSDAADDAPTREELEDYARAPGRTGKEIWSWLRDRGIETSERSVYRWLEDFRLEDRTRRAGDMAGTLIEAAKESGGLAIQDAALLQISHLIFESAASSEGVSAQDLNMFALAMQRVTLAKKRVEEVRAKFDTAASKLVAAGRAITQADIDEVRKATFG